MKTILIATALLAVPAFAQNDTSITTQSATSSSADKTLTKPMPTAKDMMQPNDTSITTRSAVSQSGNTADMSGMASTTSYTPAPAPRTDYPWCSKTVTDGCKQRFDPK